MRKPTLATLARNPIFTCLNSNTHTNPTHQTNIDKNKKANDNNSKQRCASRHLPSKAVSRYFTYARINSARRFFTFDH